MKRNFHYLTAALTLAAAGPVCAQTSMTTQAAPNARSQRLVKPVQKLRLEDYPRIFDLVPDDAALVALDQVNKYKDPILAELNQTRSYYRVFQIEKDGRLTLLASTVGAKNRKYVVQSDFTQYADKIVDGTPQRVGYLIRIQSDFDSLSNNLDLSGIFPLGVAAKANKISGTLSVQVHGLSGQKIGTLVGQPFALSDESLMKAIESAVILRSKVTEDGIFLLPAVLPD